MIQTSLLRPYLGAYINLARNNMFSTLKFIGSSVGAKGGLDHHEEQMHLMSILDSKIQLSPEQKLRASRLFFLHFPFLKYLSSDQEDLTIKFEQIRGSVLAYANVLSWWRNIYSHSRAVEDRSNSMYPHLRRYEEDVCRFLSNIPTVSARIIKERYSGRNEAQKGMLAEGALEFLTKSRFKRSKSPDGKPLMVLNTQHFLYPKERGEALPNGTNPDRLSLSGKIQLICLFLEKKYITEFLSQIHYLDDFSEKADAPTLSQRRLALEVISALRIRLPERRIHSDKDEMQVALDILGELKKCPYEVFDLLSAKDKAAFSVPSSDGETVLLRRSSDRFVQLALSYLDTTNAFENLRFQVNTGVFRYLFNDSKLCVDSQRRLRVLQEPLNGFGRIQEVEKIRSAENREIWQEFNILGFDDSPRNDASCLPYISDVYTRYLFDGDNIGMRLDGDYLPTISLAEDGIRYKVSRRKADCTISRFDLPAMLFYHLIRPLKESAPSAETLISEAVTRYRSFFSDIAGGKLNPLPDSETEESFSYQLSDCYGISQKEIPDKIKDYLFRRVDDRERFAKHKHLLLQKMKDETERRLELILEQRKIVQMDHKTGHRSENKAGKRGYVQIKPGNLASFLAGDIVRLQEGKDKLTGLNYSVMQGAIATFSTHDSDAKKKLLRLFENAGLISPTGEAGNHPFLWAVMKKVDVNSTIDLYIEYLKARKVFLAGSIPDTAQFLHADRVRWTSRDTDYYKRFAKRLLDQPIKLTGSVFEKPIRSILVGLGSPELGSYITEERCNVAYMIQCYQSLILNDSPQCFYGLCEDSNYRLYSLVHKYPKEASMVINSLPKESVYYKTLTQVMDWTNKHPEHNHKTPHKQPKPTFETIRDRIRSAYKELTSSKRLIRRLATQDTVLFMAASSSIKKLLELPEENNNLKLYQIGRQDEPSILERRIPKVVKHVRFDWTDSQRNDARPTPKHVAVEVEDICIKDYGEVYKLIHDKRVASLVHRLNVRAVSAAELQKELDSYDNRRVGVFKDIFEYENIVLNSIEDTPVSPNFETIQSFDTSHSPEEKFAARLIRNGFSHNSYPTKIARSKAFHKVVIYEENIPKIAESMAKTISSLPKKVDKK